MNTSDAVNRAYWDKRLKREASALTGAEFVAELNARLVGAACPTGVKFALVHVLGQETLGWAGPESAKTWVRRLVQELTVDFPMPLPFQLDPMGESPPCPDLDASQDPEAEDG